MRISKSDGFSSCSTFKRDALFGAAVAQGHLYEDLASGCRDDRPGLLADPDPTVAGPVFDVVITKIIKLDVAALARACGRGMTQLRLRCCSRGGGYRLSDLDRYVIFTRGSLNRRPNSACRANDGSQTG